jgi:serine/threonine protein phosphatase PrpC
MGTYLSTPVTEKGVESGECLSDEISPLVWSVVDMQGWRKSMEDAHVADTSVPVPRHMILHAQHGADHEHAKVFGVFDGHGGSEVARFCQLYLVDVLCKQEEWQLDTHPKNDARDPATTLVGLALVKTFHALDRMIDDRSRR